ncbi:hypothetical protein [Nocardia sp. NPDC003345]
MLALVMTPDEVPLNDQWRITPTPMNYGTISGAPASAGNSGKMRELPCEIALLDSHAEFDRRIPAGGAYIAGEAMMAGWALARPPRPVATRAVRARTGPLAAG